MAEGLVLVERLIASACALMSASASLVSAADRSCEQIGRGREDVVALGQVRQRVVASVFQLEVGGRGQERGVGASAGQRRGAAGHVRPDRNPLARRDRLRPAFASIATT